MTALATRSLVVDPVAPSISRFVGRQRELTFIQNQCEIALGGRARIVFLVGELGIGKTRLLDEVAARAAEDGVVVLRGGASESEGMPPYLPFLEALGQHIRVTPPSILREQIPVAPQLLASLLPELTSTLGEFGATVYSSSPEQARLRLYQAVSMFLEAIGGPRGLILMLDDLHWADSASLDLLCYIARHHTHARQLVLLTCREGDIEQNPAFERAVSELLRQRALTVVAVNLLSEEEVGDLAASYLGGPVSPAVSRLVYEQSEGNPFFAEELMRSWLEVEAIVKRSNEWVAVAPLEHSLPSSIVGVLRQRFVRLSAEVVGHLRVAAAIGRTFDLSLLATVEGQEIEALEECLLEAERAGLVRTDQQGIFTFSHEKIRQCLYDEVSFSRRRRLHGTIGRALEARYDQAGTRGAHLLPELAFHFARGGDHGRGATFSELAAEQARRSSANPEAMAHYRMALELLDPHDARRGHLLLSLGEVALLAGVQDVARSAYEEALTCLLGYGELGTAARAAHGLGLANWRRNALREAREALERALELLDGAPVAEVVRVLVDLSTLLTIYMGEQEEGIASARQALEMARQLGDRSLEAGASRAAAGKIFVSGKEGLIALEALWQALALAQESDNPSEAAWCYFYLSGTYYWRAEVARAYEVSLRGIEFIERSGQPYHLRSSYSWLALLLSSRGAWSEAEQALERAQLVLDQLSDPVQLAFLHLFRGFLSYQREDYTTAEREFQAARANRLEGTLGLIFFPPGLLGLARIAQGKRAEASAALLELEALLAELLPGTLSMATTMTCLALLAIALGDRERAAALYPRLAAFSGQYNWFLVDRVLGELATLCREWEVAMAHLSAAEQTARREDLRPELARTLLARANCEVARGGEGSEERAADFLKQGLAIFEELNMSGAAELVRSQLGVLASHPRLSTPRPLPAALTPGQARVLQLVAEGWSNGQIARELGISEKTVANHLTHIFNKTGSANRAAAAAFAIRRGLA